MRVFAAAAFVLAAGIVPAGCGHGASENEANVTPPPATVKVATVRQATVPITEDYQGTIGAIESVEIRARVQGTLDRAPFQEGALVHRGDLIFQIQQSEYLAALHAAQAQLAAAQGNLFARRAALARANTTVARNRPLAAERAIPQKDLDNALQNAQIAQGDVLVAQAQIASAKAAIDNAQINVGYTMIYAPVTGLIGFLNYDVGNVVGGPATQVLDTVTSIDPIEVGFALDEPTYLSLARGAGLRDQDLRIVLANDASYPFAGRVFSISPTVDPKTGTIAVKAHFPNPDGLLRPGGFARVRVMIERRSNALLVPQTAIVKSQGVDTVYVVNSKDEAALRTVSLGPQYQQAFVVESGLSPGDRIIVTGTQKVVPGAKVSVQK
jgi:RND family efflux transporter MFP subunit